MNRYCALPSDLREINHPWMQGLHSIFGTHLSWALIEFLTREWKRNSRPKRQIRIVLRVVGVTTMKLKLWKKKNRSIDLFYQLKYWKYLNGILKFPASFSCYSCNSLLDIGCEPNLNGHMNLEPYAAECNNFTRYRLWENMTYEPACMMLIVRREVSADRTCFYVHLKIIRRTDIIINNVGTFT